MRPQNLYFTALLALLPTLAPAFQPLFDTAAYFNADCEPTAVAAGDFDRDGDVDVAVTNFCYFSGFGKTISILKNNGDGTFAARIDYETGNRPRSVYAADLDKDGYIDLAIANWGQSTVSVLRNNGDGTFAPKIDYQIWPDPWSLFGSDLDGDGDEDLMAATDPGASILFNNGDGTFGSAINYRTTETLHSAIISADFNLDGSKDLAILGINGGEDRSGTMTVLLNSGNGVFTNPIDYEVGDCRWVSPH